MLVSLSSILMGFVIVTPAVVAHADSAQRTSWNTVSNQMYRLEGNQDVIWVPMDPDKLVLTVTPTVDSTAVLSAFSDVESSTTLNTDIGIEIDNTGSPIAWKEGGEYTGSSPDPVYVQAPYPMTHGVTYVITLVWKARTPQADGTFLEAGDPVPPDGPLFSPTTLNALLTPTLDNFVPNIVSTGSSLFSTTSASWVPMDNSVMTTFVTPSGTGQYNALFTASADLYSASSAYATADMGICLEAGGTISLTCATPATMIATQTSGSASGSMPIASLVEATQTLDPSRTYTMAIFFRSETSGHAIYAGTSETGSTGPYSPSSIIAQLTPVADAEQSTTPLGAQTRTYSGTDDGTAWATIGTGTTLTVTPSANVLDYITANVTLSKSGGTPHVDVGICVITAGTCDGAGTDLVDYAAMSSLSGTQTAVYLQIPVFMTTTHTYTIALQWASASAMSGTESMTAGSALDVTSLTSLQVPYSAPSAPPSVSATAGNGQATVSWTASALSPGSPLTGYAVTPYLQTAAGSTTLESMDVPLTSPFTVPNLANGQTYTFTVAGINAEGAGAPTTSGSVAIGLPGAPTGVTIGSRGDGFENLSWTAPSSTGASATTGYLVTPYIAGVAQTTTTVWGTGTSATITGLTDGTTYTFGVATINVFGTGSAGTSGSNSPHKVVPGAPTGVTGTAGNAQATVSWSAPAASGGAAITAYTITPYIGATAQATTSASTSPATVSGLTNATTYTFTVAAVNSIGTGAASSNSWAVLPATTPVVPSMTVAVDKGSSATYAIGNAITYTATVSSNAGAATTAAFTDALPAGVSGSGGLILVNGAACSGGITCTATATTISVSGLSIPATGTVVVTDALTVVGTPRSCAVETDSASVTIASGNSVGATTPFTACDSDLGTNGWSSFITQTLGDGGSAGVNPANGNLVVTQTDSMPMQLHGGLSFDLTRTYNSQDTDLAGIPNIVGAGWIVSFVDAGTDPAGIALVVPPVAAVANPVPITLVDGSGARYVYAPSALSTVINVGSIATGVLATAVPNNLAKTAGYNQRCIDEEYNPPAGVHVAMWRYIETTGTCATLSTSSNVIIGYATLGADRIRHEYNALGELINMNDAVGNQVNYTYNGSNQLTVVAEQGGSGRKFAISYSTTIKITDAGGEKTTYTDTSGNLTTAANPDGTTLTYTYGGCTGSSSVQLCSAKDGRGHPTDFTYTAAAAGPAMVATIVDRNSNSSTITYNSTNVTADRGTERTAYAAIDAFGRVGEVDAGSTSNVWLHRTFYSWDTAAAGCRQPDAGVDNDLCSIIRRGLTAGAPDRVTYYKYGDEGQMLTQRDIDSPTDLYTTAGYQEEYFEAGVSVSTYTDTIAGSGNVTSTTQSGGRKDSGTLFDVFTQQGSLTPSGNAAGTGFGSFESLYEVDDNFAVSTNTANGATTLCSPPGSPAANTGLLCEIVGPVFDTTGDVSYTSYTYNADGTRATMETPIESAGSLTTHYAYTYYQNADDDLSGTTSAGGWLKGITDPTGNFTTFAYDAEGQQVRSWDRDATAGLTLGLSTWNSLASPPSTAYTETLYTNGSDTSASTFSAPTRDVVASRTQLNEWTTDTVDANGNVIGTRKPNAPSPGPTSTPVCPQPMTTQTFDTCRTYDDNDNLATSITPREADKNNVGNALTQHFSSYTYDAFDNPVSTTDPNGNVTTTAYDTLNRATTRSWTMAIWGAMAAPTGCFDSTSANAPIPTGDLTCSSEIAYDGGDNAISTTNGSGYTSYALFDAVHRAIASITPRGQGLLVNLVSVTLYNQDGKVTDVCSPREQSEGGADAYVCNATSTYGTHTIYNDAGWVASTSTYQVAGTAADTTTFEYDADGNKTKVTNARHYATAYAYSELDRLATMAVPRSSSVGPYTTTYTYDASGSLLEEAQPINGTNLILTEYTYDVDHRVIDTIKGASVANSTNLYSNTSGTDVRTRNVYDLDGNVTEQYSPNAFFAPGTYSAPNPIFATGAAYNEDDEQSVVYTPRYDTATTHLTDAIGTTQTPVQNNDCPTSTSVLNFPATTGVCKTSYFYDPDGNVATVNWPTQTSADANPLTTYAYTNTNQVLRETDPDPAGPSAHTVAAETYAYDAEGNRTDETDANLIATQTTYTDDNLVSGTTQTPNGPTSHITGMLYDANGEQIQVTDPDGNSTETTFDANGLTATVTDGAGDETLYAYDAVGNATEITSPDAHADAAANPTGLATYNVYTEDNLLAATLIPDDAADTQRAICYGYDESGRKINQGNTLITGAPIITEPPACSAGPPAFSFAFTNQSDGRLATETGRVGGSTLTYAYDANGNQLTSADSISTVSTTDTYYADNLLRTALDNTGSRTTDYAYDGAGNVTGRNSVLTGATAYKDTIAYNDADLQASETTSISTGVQSWTYDHGGRLTQIAAANGDVTNDSYATDGTLDQEVLLNAAGHTDANFTQTLDGDFRVTSDGCIGCENTNDTGVVGHTFTYQYDAAGRLTFIDASGGSAAFQTYDQDGNRINHDDVVTGIYTYYSYNADNSIASTIVGGTPETATYDTYGGGVMTSDGCKQWTPDAFDRATTLAAVGTPPSGCPTAPPTTTYTYDANGTMVTETAGGTTSTMHNDPETSTPIVETMGSTDTAYVLDGAGTPIESQQGATDTYLTDDPKGDFSTVVGSAGSWPTCQIQFDPYGTVVFGLATSNNCETGGTTVDLLYQNDRMDASSGDYQLGYRTYDPSKNSFLEPDHFQMGSPAQDLSIQVDPLTADAYAFVDGDPVNGFDPTGHGITTCDYGCAGGGDGTPCEYTHTCGSPSGGPSITPSTKPTPKPKCVTALCVHGGQGNGGGGSASSGAPHAEIIVEACTEIVLPASDGPPLPVEPRCGLGIATLSTTRAQAEQALCNGQPASACSMTVIGAYFEAGYSGPTSGPTWGDSPFPIEGGGGYINGRWYTEHALERMAPDTPYVRAMLEARFQARAERLGYRPGTPEYQDYQQEFGPNPQGVPSSVTEAQLADPELDSGVTVVVNSSGDVVSVIKLPGDIIPADPIEP
jgi:RHS repeat-associated protein